MKKIFHGLMGIALCTITICHAAPQVDFVKVAPQGTTDVTAAFGKTRVSVKITTHEVDIGKPSDPWPEKKLSSCTYSRFPCSPVDYMEISVNGNILFVARSVYADLADIGVASLRQEKRGQFVLILGGGDASESYTAEVIFDGNMVKQRTVKSNEAQRIMQSTTYFASPSMDN